jgi:hypothetical protein
MTHSGHLDRFRAPCQQTDWAATRLRCFVRLANAAIREVIDADWLTHRLAQSPFPVVNASGVAHAGEETRDFRFQIGGAC